MSPQVVPIPADPPLGLGKERGIALGGGGEWFVFWLVAYLEKARQQGVDLGRADVSVGTSAGSMVGTYLTSQTVAPAFEQLSQLASNPAILEKLVVTNTGSPSQTRATQISASTTSTDAKSVKEVGRAAMASKNVAAADYEASIAQVLGRTEWPSAVHHVTATDCYTAERVVVSADSDIPIATACAASSSVPGINGPVWLDDHYCMDGGISASSTHSDLLAGAERVIIFSLLSKPPKAGSFGFAMRINPDGLTEEVTYLESKGSKVMLICADPPEGTDFMDPTQLPGALEAGAARATADAAALAEFWN